MNRKSFLLSFGLFLISSLASYAWGPIGHGTVCTIAEYNVKPSTLKQVEHYLGRSMSFYCVWADEFRSDPRYAYSSSHVARIDKDNKYFFPEGKKQDAVKTIEQAMSVIRDRKHQSDSAVAVNIKLLIHLVGDLHCPVHLERLDLRLCTFKVSSYEKPDSKTTYHGIWDQGILERRCENLSPRELARDLDRLDRKTIKEVQSGTLVDWVEQTARETEFVVYMVKEGDVLSKDFYNSTWDTAQRQLQLGGYRLAALLDDLFK